MELENKKSLYKSTLFCENIRESENVFRTRMDMIEAARLAFLNETPKTIENQNKVLFRSNYFPADFQTAVSNFITYATQNLPSFLFAGKNKIGNIQKREIDKIIKSTFSSAQINFKIQKIIETSLIDGLCVFRCKYKPNKPTIWINDKNNILVKKELEEVGDIDIEIFPSYNVRLDPSCDPFNISETSEYIIIKAQENISKARIISIAQEDEWDISYDDINNIPSGDMDTYLKDQEKFVTGMNKNYQKTYNIYYMFLKNGNVQTICNGFVVKEAINSNMCVENPLIIFSPFSSQIQPYGITLWELVENAIKAKGIMLNLIADSAIKNLSAVVYTSSINVVNQMASGDVKPGSVIHVETVGDKNVNDMFYSHTVPDFSNGLNTTLNIVQNDINKILKIAEINQGVAGRSQIRVAGAAEAMNSATENSVANINRSVEINVFAKIAKQILQILASYFYRFEMPEEITQDDLINAYRNIRIKNGSSLTEDRISLTNTLGELFQFGQQEANASLFKLTDIIKDYFNSKGLDIEEYLEDTDTTELKENLKNEIPINNAKTIMNNLR